MSLGVPAEIQSVVAGERRLGRVTFGGSGGPWVVASARATGAGPPGSSLF